MKITLKLFATLGDYLPANAFENAASIDVDGRVTPNSLIDKYRVPRELAHLVLINGVYCAQPERDSAVLNEGDTLAIWPPVAGG